MEAAQELLGLDHQGQFKFRCDGRSIRTSFSNVQDLKPSHSDITSSLVSDLSPLAQKLLQSIHIHSQQTGNTDTKKLNKAKALGKVKSDDAKLQYANSANQEAFAINSNLPQPVRSPQQSQRPVVSPTVEVPQKLNSLDRSAYQALPDVDKRVSMIASPVLGKRKRANDNTYNQPLQVDLDFQNKSDAALERLETLLGDVFDVDDNINLKQFEPSELSSQEYFTLLPATDGEGSRILTVDTQLKLDIAVKEAIDSSCLSEVPVTSLLRLLGLCEKVVRGSEGIDVPDNHDGEDSDLTDQIRSAESLLHAAKIVLRVMAAGRNEKQLLSEDTLSAVISATKNIIDQLIVPVAEVRNGSSNSSFDLLSEKKPLIAVLHALNKILHLLGAVLDMVEFTEATVTSAEFMVMRLIFTENAHAEKDALLGVSRFESVRRTAMELVVKIFCNYPDQRSFIFDEILTSLEKLPVTRQSARQFKMIDGKAIQLVSALVMQLIQSTAVSSKGNEPRDPDTMPGETATGNHDEDELSSQFTKHANGIQKSECTSEVGDSLIPKLNSAVSPLYTACYGSARYVIQYLVQRALNSTKSGDQPYRLLLDIFTEDFLIVLGSPEWPAAELLLRTLLLKLLSLTENDKLPAPHRNMALDIMGTMGSGIADASRAVFQASTSTENGEGQASDHLKNLISTLREGDIEDRKLTETGGLYNMLVDHLSINSSNSLQSDSAKGYYIMDWAKTLCSLPSIKPESEEAENDEKVSKPISSEATMLYKMLVAPDLVRAPLLSISNSEARVASMLLTLCSPFCKAQNRIVQVLISSIMSDQATVKSRGLKSIEQLLEKNPAILDNADFILSCILTRFTDSSPMVRDSALNLLAKCTLLKPSLDSSALEMVSGRMEDAAVSVRKRAIKIGRDMYLRHDDEETRSSIAQAILGRTSDDDAGVRDLSLQILEELWIAPFAQLSDGACVRSQTQLRRQVAQLIEIACSGDDTLNALESFLRHLQTRESKEMPYTAAVCKKMVDELFDGLIDNDQFPNRPQQRQVLLALTVFTKANPSLVKKEQLIMLQPYLKDLANADDLIIYRSVVVVFRHVLPRLGSLQQDFLRDIQGLLLKNVSRLSKFELNEVTLCLWSINKILKNPDRLVRLMISVLNGIQSEAAVQTGQSRTDASSGKLKRYMMIAGYFSKNCSFEDEMATFKERFRWWNGGSVTGLVLDILKTFLDEGTPAVLQQTAIECIGCTCQAWPRHYLRDDLMASFESILQGQDLKMEQILLRDFLDYFNSEESRSEPAVEESQAHEMTNGSTFVSKSITANENDGVSTAIAQTFLKHFIRLSLASQDETSLIATQTIASINRQGMVHPRECCPCLVALETSPQAAISDLALAAHLTIHNKHENMIEKEYMKAVDEAFSYQKRVVKDTLGALVDPFRSKLRPFFSILKDGNFKIRKKFLLNLCSRLDITLEKLGDRESLTEQLLFSRFCLQNIAFFEYMRIDEVLGVISSLERLVANTGAEIAQVIETELRPLATSNNVQQATSTTESVPPAGDEMTRHVTITTASMILQMIWETRTFLRQQWGLKSKRDLKVKPVAKDMCRAPTKVPGVTASRFWMRLTEIMSALADSETMLRQCFSFAELLAVDSEFGLSSDDESDSRLRTPSVENGDMPGTVPQSAGSRAPKRKISNPASTTPKKHRQKAVHDEDGMLTAMSPLHNAYPNSESIA